MMKSISSSQSSAQRTENDEGGGIVEPESAHIANDSANLVSELPDAKGWRDYVNQYWHANAVCHQFRDGVDMLPHERKLHRSRLSLMKIIAEYGQEKRAGDQDQFEADFALCTHDDLTVYKILAEIRKRKRA
ncbi:hypothetical protein GN958_ATG00386 [Phytophthora infestans]|nr:hypothetical protein GN958_ATG06274 [Phytophthora infestans]KAF4146631.1 hypothetical protein GN958_ATG04178 [Phytophthora infestans]KAF4150427.1 hypothetical protein GN958_ATG00386 [Phytophthora infestans]